MPPPGLGHTLANLQHFKVFAVHGFSTANQLGSLVISSQTSVLAPVSSSPTPDGDHVAPIFSPPPLPWRATGSNVQFPEGWASLSSLQLGRGAS